MAVVNGIERDRTSASNSFTVTNFAEQLSLNANAAFADAGFWALSDVVATLIRELARRGIINADIS